MKSKDTALAIAGAAYDKKALGIILIKMKKMSSVCDWFVIASGTSTTHARAIADNIVKVLKEKRQKLWHIEGQREASWILLDYSDVVCHVFLKETRSYYNLEKLWSDAPSERYKEPKRKNKFPHKRLAKKSKKK